MQPEAPPLRLDASGVLRVSRSRGLVDLAMRALQDEATPEAVAQRCPSALLADIHAVMAYALRHGEAKEAEGAFPIHRVMPKNGVNPPIRRSGSDRSMRLGQPLRLEAYRQVHFLLGGSIVTSLRWKRVDGP